MQSDQYLYWNYRPVWFDTVHFGRSPTLLPPSILKMVAAGYSKVLAHVEQSTPYHNYRTIIVIFTVVENLKWHTSSAGKLHDQNFTWLHSSPVFRGSTDNLLWELQIWWCSIQVTTRSWHTLLPTLPSASSSHHLETLRFVCGISVSLFIPYQYSRDTQSKYFYSCSRLN
jgi:hypothetical protein